MQPKEFLDCVVAVEKILDFKGYQNTNGFLWVQPSFGEGLGRGGNN
jgi:hypothetical protein